MLKKQFEDFLFEQLKVWGNNHFKAGFRYQFRSSDQNNSEHLLKALLRHQTAQITVDDTELPYIEFNHVKLIPVLHGSTNLGFTENYISRLRDQISAQSGEFKDTALLIVHNSMLDTLVNSADDLAQEKRAWHPVEVKEKLQELINPLNNQKYISESLLNLIYQQILENGGTVFGFSAIYDAIIDGDLKFSELDLLQDPDLLKFKNDTQILKRLEDNKHLRNRIAQIVERFPNELTEKLAELDFGETFIEKNFENLDSWKEHLIFSACLQEQDRNRQSGLELEAEECRAPIRLFAKDKGGTKAGKRERHLIFSLSPETSEAEFELVFIGDTIEKDEVEVKDDNENKVNFLGVNNAGGKRSRLKFRCISVISPLYFTIKLKREKTAESYTFKALILPASKFPLQEIAHKFLIWPQQRYLLLQTDENFLKISENIEVINLDDIGQTFETHTTGIVNFEKMANESAEIGFSVKTETFILDFKVEGAVASEALTLPLLLDTERYNRLCDNTYYGIFNGEKNRIILDNQEVGPKGRRLTLLQYEQKLIREKLLYCNDNDSSRNLYINDFTAYPNLQIAYDNLFNELLERKSLHSLSGWDESYQSLVKKVVFAFNEALEDIQYSELLSKEQKQLMRIGFAVFNNSELITPLHPIVLAYYLYLAEQVYQDKNQTQSFAKLPKVTRERLNPQGLIPFLYHPHYEFSYVQVERENSFWLKLVPQQETSLSFIRKLVAEKVSEFQTAFSALFNCGPKAKFLINSINNQGNYDLFMGLVDLVKQLRDKVPYIHVCLYDDALIRTEFDYFAELGKHHEIKERYGLNKGKSRDYADLIVDLLRTRLTYSKYENHQVESQHYAHISFFRNNQRVERTDIDPAQELSGIVCSGLIPGEAAANKQDSYFTAFGLKNVEIDGLLHLDLAQKYNRLLKPALKTNEQYGVAKATALAVNDSFKTLLERSYDNSIWTCIIDPKVTLDFFEKSKDVVLIHYSDNYTNSTNYDAITVTKQTSLYRKVLDRDKAEYEKSGYIEEFNAFNGEWLLKMITDNPNERKAKRGVIGAYKYVNGLLSQSDITWVPLSVAEMIRVSGNIGLKMSDADFARSVQGYKQGAISDDVLFVGFKNNVVYLLPVEVKTGKRQTYSVGFQQAKELRRYLIEDLLGKNDLASLLYRGLFARQLLMQVEKYKLYNLFKPNYFDALIEEREQWLKGEYQIGTLNRYPEGFLFVNVEDDVFIEPCFSMKEGILKIEIPKPYLTDLIGYPLQDWSTNVTSAKLFNIPEEYILKPYIDNKEDISISSLSSANQQDLSNSSEKDDKSKEISSLDTIEQPQEPLKVLFGHDARSEQALYWEPTNTAKFMNTNTGIIGTMGTGKTQFTKAVITQLYRNQHHNVSAASIGMLIFDYKSDYVDEVFLNATRAKKFNLFKLPYNPLSLFGDTPMLPVHTARAFSETMGTAFNLGEKQKLILRRLVAEAYEAVGISKTDPSTWNRSAPTIKDVWTRFEESEPAQDSLYAALETLNELEVFESDQSKCLSLYDLIKRIIVIELAGYDKEIQSLVVALTLNLFYSQMQKYGKPEVQGDFRQITKLILVDEADNFMSQDFPSLRRIMKEGREYGVGVILSTQDITHFKTGENNYASYIMTWIIHRVAEIRNADIKAIFNIDDRGQQEGLMETIRRLEKHYSLYINGEKRLTKMRDKAFWEIINE